MGLKCLAVLHIFLFQRGSNWSTFIRSATSLERPKLENPLPSSPHLFLTLRHRVRWSSCPLLTMHHLYPYRAENTSVPWNELRWTNGAESSLCWQEWKPAFPASHQLNEVSMSIQLHLFSRIITLSWLQTNPLLGWFSGWTLCFIFSWPVGLQRRAHQMAIVWDCHSRCKHDPFEGELVCYAVTHGPSPARSFGPKPSSTFLREKIRWGRRQ